MATIHPPINFKQWIDDNRHLLKPPVGNKCVWKDGEYIIMVVGGPNSRKDYHYNETPEFFYQLEGDMLLKIQDDGKSVDIPIREGEIFLLPAKVPHSPQRKANTVGLVVEYPRAEGVKDALQWYCEQCNHQLHNAPFELKDIESDMPHIFDKFYGNLDLRTCDACGHVMEPPETIS